MFLHSKVTVLHNGSISNDCQLMISTNLQYATCTFQCKYLTQSTHMGSSLIPPGLSCCLAPLLPVAPASTSVAWTCSSFLSLSLYLRGSLLTQVLALGLPTAFCSSCLTCTDHCHCQAVYSFDRALIWCAFLMPVVRTTMSHTDKCFY